MCPCIVFVFTGGEVLTPMLVVVLVLGYSQRPSVGTIDRAIDRSDRSIRSIRYEFRFFGNVGELEICLVSKFQLCTTLGGRKNAEKPKREFSEFSVRSVRYSIRFDRYCVRGSWWTALLPRFRTHLLIDSPFVFYFMCPDGRSSAAPVSSTVPKKKII